MWFVDRARLWVVRSFNRLERVIRIRKESWTFSLKYAVVKIGDLQNLSGLDRVRDFSLVSIIG